MKKLISILSLILLFSPAFAQTFNDAQMFGSARGTAFNTFDFEEITEDVVHHEFVINNKDIVEVTIVSVSLPQGVSVMIPKKVIEGEGKGTVLVTVYREYVTNLDENNKFDEKFAITVQQSLLTGIIINKTYIYQVSGQFK
jgi:hypothetical protein